MRTWIRDCGQSLSVLALGTVATGLIYPLVITAFGALAFPRERSGSLFSVGGEIRGSELLAQKTTDPKWFWPRPSAADYATIPSGASNLAPSSKKLEENILNERKRWGGDVPPELLMTSGSGLDPHLSWEGVEVQLPRICLARSLGADRCGELRSRFTKEIEGPTLGFLGRRRVNVNRLNVILAEEEK